MRKRVVETSDGRKGGLLKGDPHSAPSGGMNAIVVTDNDKPILVEGEEAIINKTSMRSPKRFTITGTTKEIVSTLNQKGGGVPIGDSEAEIKSEFKTGGSIEQNEFKVKVYLAEHSYNVETSKNTAMWFCRVYKMNGKDVDGILTEDDDLDGSDIGSFDSKQKAKDFIWEHRSELSVILLDDKGVGIKVFNYSEDKFKTGGSIDNPNFKKWFGDSKVVDEKGNPLVVYHATQSDFDKFDLDKVGSSIDYGTMGEGFYFTDNIENVNNYAKNLHSNTGKKEGDNIVPVYLSLQNPYTEISFTELSGISKKESIKLSDKIKRKGYDGIIAEFGYPEVIKWYVVFEPTQIKSAIGNNGNFDGNNPNITFAEGGGIGDDVDIAYAKAVKDFEKEGFDVIESSDSKTDFGHSKYFYVNYKDRSSDNLGSGIKVRVSDHGVTNKFRMLEELHIIPEMYSFTVKIAITDAKILLMPELFKKENDIKNIPYEKEVRQSKLKDTDIIISERFGSGKRVPVTEKVYTVKRFSSKPIIKIIDKKTGELVKSYETETFAEGGSIKENKMEENIGTQLNIADGLDSNKSIGLFNSNSSEPVLFAQGGAVSGKSEGNWNEIPVGWKNTSKIAKLTKLEYDPKNKDFNSVFGSFVSNDLIRPVMMGVYFDDKNIVATDAHRIIVTPNTTEFRGIYPTLNDKKVDLNSEGKIDGTYPKYEAVIRPKDGDTLSFKFDCYKLLQYCNVALNFANKITHQIAFRVDKDNVIGFNGKFLIEILKTSLKLGHEKLYFNYTEPSRSGIFSPDENYSVGSSLVLVLMPVMLNSNVGEIGTRDIDFGEEFTCYFDFSKNEIIDADGSVADFKMNYGKNDIFTDEVVKVLKSVIPKNSKVLLFESFVVVDKKAIATDLGTYIEIDNINVTDGLYEVNNGAVSVSGSNSDYTDFPKLPEITKLIVEFNLEANYLKWLIDKLSDFTGNDDLRPVMSGINIQKEYNGVFATATDAHKLMTIDISDHIDLKTEDDFNFIISIDNLINYLSFVGDVKVNFKSAETSSKNTQSDFIFIETENSRFVSKNIDGKYPNYRAVIPKENIHKLSVDLKDFKNLLNGKEAKSFKQKHRKEADSINVIGEENINGELSIKISANKRAEKYSDPDEIIDSLYLGKLDVVIGHEYYSATSECALVMPIMHKVDTEFIFAFAYDVFSGFVDGLDGKELELIYSDKSRAYIANESNIIYNAPKGKKIIEKKVEVKEVINTPEPTQEESIPDLIEGLRLLLEDMEGEEKQEILDLIEGLELLIEDESDEGEDENEVYIEFLNKEKNFKKDKKYFKSYEEAVEWGRENTERFKSDMIRYTYAKGGELVTFKSEIDLDREIMEAQFGKNNI
jgi:DNA polymerase III sliding clamp (beta) subunit (PCNA family)